MIQCTFHLNGNQLSNLSCPGIGFFPAYSGTGTSRNNANDIAIPSIDRYRQVYTTLLHVVQVVH